jgi:hypothetical protein
VFGRARAHVEGLRAQAWKKAVKVGSDRRMYFASLCRVRVMYFFLDG